MAAANYDLTIDQGSTFVIDITVKESGSVKDLTGYSARAQMRSTKTASEVAASFTCSIPIRLLQLWKESISPNNCMNTRKKNYVH